MPVTKVERKEWRKGRGGKRKGRGKKERRKWMKGRKKGKKVLIKAIFGFLTLAS